MCCVNTDAQLLASMDGIGNHSRKPTSTLKFKDGLNTLRVRVSVPFKPKDIFREFVKPPLINGRACPLDVNEEKMVSVEHIRPGSDRENPNTSPGYIRKVIYEKGMTTLHELVECVEPSIIKWKVLHATKVPVMLTAHSRCPECTIELKSDGVGSSCEITYVFEGSRVMVPLCCLAPLLPYAMRMIFMRRLQENVINGMIDRGYEVSQASPKTYLPRSLHNADPVTGTLIKSGHQRPLC